MRSISNFFLISGGNKVRISLELPVSVQTNITGSLPIWKYFLERNVCKEKILQCSEQGLNDSQSDLQAEYYSLQECEEAFAILLIDVREVLNEKQLFETIT